MTRTGGGAMTPLEDRVRDAIRAKAAEVPPDAVPPLRLRPAAGPPLSRSRWQGEREGRRAGPRTGRAWTAPIAAAAGVAAALAVCSP